MVVMVVVLVVEGGPEGCEGKKTRGFEGSEGVV
jgi:hypothetical protein